jgi:uncharacterized protein (TIGR02679 family)
VTESVAERIRALLGGPHYEKLFAAIRQRVEAAGEGARSMTIAHFDPFERRALADLLGLASLPDGTVRLDLGRLDDALRRSAVALPLEEVLEALGGPLRDRRAERLSQRVAREQMWAAAAAQLAAAGRVDLVGWVEGLRSTGALVRTARAADAVPGELLDAAVHVALRLPANGELLPVFAASVAGDPHALDLGTPLGALVVRAAAAVAGRREVPSSAPERRRLWREVGIDCDSLSADVLVCGLRPGGEDRLARHLRESAEAGDPTRVTLRELSRADGLRFEPGSPVFVCENPAVVESGADVLGPRCAQLVCVEGVPSTAAMTLLRRIATVGARVRVHADFDWAGLRIAEQVLLATRGEPWRFGAVDYRAATSLAAQRGRPALTGVPAASRWDDKLARVMGEKGIAVSEEEVLGGLLEDLARR